MVFSRIFTVFLMISSILVVSACGVLGPSSDDPADYYRDEDEVGAAPGEDNIWDLFGDVDNPNITLEVNKYIWNASLDVLNFLPIQAADPFSGVIVTGFGTPPGGGRSYRATVYIQDPALDARSLNIALYTKSGPASADAVRAVEDAILTRARQLRLRDGDL
ncbi:MAG: DUF3576 domain-containing protein [Pseudoruegeria sp.]